MKHKDSVSFFAFLISILIVASLVNATTLPVTITPDNLVIRDENGNIIATSLTVALINNTDGYVQLARALTESGTIFPTVPAVGYLYYRTDLQSLYIWTGLQWVTAMSATLPPGTISYNDLADKPDLTVYLFMNGSRPLDADWNTGAYGIYGLTFLNATSITVTNLNATNVYANTVYLGNLLTDPVAPAKGQMWYNSAEDTLKYYNGTAIVIVPGIGGGSSSSYTLPYTYTVYKTGSTYYMEKYDGTLYSSTNASKVFNFAVGNLSSGESSTGLNAAAKAGSIRVLDAYYNLDTAIGIGRQTKIAGSSMMTVFNVTANVDCFWINNGTDDSIYSDWKISDLQIDMNQKSGNGICGNWSTHSGNKWGGSINNVIIREIKAGYAGISLGQTMLLNIQHVRMDTYGIGMYLYDSSTVSLNTGESYIADVIIGVHNDATGIKLEGAAYSGSYVINAMEFHRIEILDSEAALGGTGQTGINLTWVGRTSFYNSIIEYMDYGVWIQSHGASFCENIQFVNTGMWGIKNTAVYMVSGSRGITFDGGQIYMGAGSSYVWRDLTSYSGTDYPNKQNKIRNVMFGGGLTITNAMLAWGLRTEVYDCSFYNDTLYPQRIAIATPFASYASHNGIFVAQGSAASPTNTTTYIAFNTEYYISVSGGSGVNVTIALPSGGTKIIDAAATLEAFRIPRSWTFTCTWTTAPTVTVWSCS